mmetsp:Transcript_29367/g.62416  ORF Transcript_29367/g.62416 Transcript_29367/m.62416 type:complete len:322 (+) Transcript_29367:156-1121(+)
MQVSFGVVELLELFNGGLQVLLSHGDVLLRLGLGALQIHRLLVVGGDGLVGVFHEDFVDCLGLLLGSNSLVLRFPGVGDDCLNHGDNLGPTCVFVVLGEASRSIASIRVVARRLDVRCTGLRFFLEHGVDLLHTGQGLLQDGLGQALVSDGLLVLGVLGFPILGGPLHLLLHLSDSGDSRIDVLREGGDGLFEVGDVGFKGLLGVVSGAGGSIVGSEFVDAPIAMLNFVLLLLFQLSYHLVDLGFDLFEGVQLRARREERELRCRCGRCRPPENGDGVAEALLCGRRGLCLKETVHSLVESEECLVLIEDFDGLLDCCDLV